MLDRKEQGPCCNGATAAHAIAPQRDDGGRGIVLLALLLMQCCAGHWGFAQQPAAASQIHSSAYKASPIPRPDGDIPPRAAEAQRFLRERGWIPGDPLPRRGMRRARSGSTRAGTAAARALQLQIGGSAGSNAAWQPLGPMAVDTADFGLVSGRVTALALDPSDSTGNRLYVGTTGGGVWMANNAAATAPSVVFTPLTDNVAALSGAVDASISIGALTVQPGGTGVILAGTGDPNDVLDSYYGAGILRSADGGNTWSLIQMTSDAEDDLSPQDVSFAGNGFAGFAWSTVNPQVVVAAVSQAYESTLVDANRANVSYEGLFYSADSGATWHLATIRDGSGSVMQGPLNTNLSPNGNAATAVVWNPVRQLFLAAVRYHGYYQSSDGITWTRMSAQPGAGLTTRMCPTHDGTYGSIACPIYRGALAVNPLTGDTFAWTVDLNNQDQGLWQDQCAISRGSCTNPAITFAKQWNTAALETSTLQGAATITNGDYDLTLAAVPSQQDTQVLAGANDVWKCSLAMGCAWRNTTNATTCRSAEVGGYQHAVEWNSSNPLEILIGNDSGLWRSMDAIGETGTACSAADSGHFQNLNGSLGSLAEIVSMAPSASSPYSMMAGLGVNGTAGVKATAVTADWPQILSGDGGPVAIDPNNAKNWFVNTEAGVVIYRCSEEGPCTAAAFGSSPVVTSADVGGDGDTMPVPAVFLVDPADSTQLLIGSCRVWRGPGNPSGAWSASNAISPVLDSGVAGGPCNGDALIRSMAAMPLASGGEVIYVGMYGASSYGANLAGHVLKAVFDPTAGSPPTWSDLTLNPVSNDAHAVNYYGLDLSSVTIDPHDATGETVYVTVEGMENPLQEIQVVYRSTDGGKTWSDITANLPTAPANSLAVDPQSANTVYVATDEGVYFTTDVASCTQRLSNCWSAFGAGLPDAPVVALSVSGGPTSQALVAGTYGRGTWQAPVWSAGTALTTASPSPASLAFPAQVYGTASSSMTVTLENTGSQALATTSIVTSGDFSETDNCVNAVVAAGASCTVQVTFVPQATGPRSGAMTIFANVYGGQMGVALTGTGAPQGAVTLMPPIVSFGQVQVGTTSPALEVTVANGSDAAVPVNSIAVTPPFAIASNACGTTSLAAQSDCQVEVEFAPTQAGPAAGLLTFADAAGTQTVELSGTGEAAPTDILSLSSLAFPATAEGQISAAQAVTITNTGGAPLTSISISASAEFQESSNCGTQLAGGAVCTVSVQMEPAQVGAVTGELTISDALRTQTVALSGAGLTPAAFSVNPGSLAFTNQQPGVPSAPQTLTIANTGGAPMANIGFEITGAAAASYAVSASTCGSLAANGGSCTAQVVFTPGGTGAIAATLAISTSTPGVRAVSVPLNGSGQLANGLATNPTQVTFPVVAAGQSSGAQAITVTNSSEYAIGGVALTAGAPFSITQNRCTGSLAAGANCTAAIIFQPSGGGAATGALTVSSAAVAAPATVALSGTGFAFAVSVSGPASETVANGQQANYTLVISPSGSGGTFSFSCGTLPANALCLFNPPTESLNPGVQGNVEVEISTGAGTRAGNERPAFRPLLSLACGLLLLPLAVRRRRRIFAAILLGVILTAGTASCTNSSGGSSGSGSSGQSGGSGTAAGTYTIPVSVTSLGITQSVNLTLTVD